MKTEIAPKFSLSVNKLDDSIVTKFVLFFSFDRVIALRSKFFDDCRKVDCLSVLKHVDCIIDQKQRTLDKNMIEFSIFFSKMFVEPVLPNPALQCIVIGGPQGFPFQESPKLITKSVCLFSIALMKFKIASGDRGKLMSGQLPIMKCVTVLVRFSSKNYTHWKERKKCVCFHYF